MERQKLLALAYEGALVLWAEAKQADQARNGNSRVYGRSADQWWKCVEEIEAELIQLEEPNEAE